MNKCVWLWTTIAALSIAACTKSSPASPSATPDEQSSAAITDAKTGVTLTTPAAVSPASNAQIRYADQPITLTVRNAVTTGNAALTYTFQVASDGAFASMVQVKDAVPAGAGQTSVTLDKLAGAQTYYWRVRANHGSVNGLFTPPRAMAIGPEVVIQAPGIISPATGGTLNGQGLLVVQDAPRSGPAGVLSYRFEVSDTSGFGNLVFTATVGEQAGQTAARVDANLTTNATYYWRARASDPSSGALGPYSAVASFRFVPFDMKQATILGSPSDLGFWPETAKITSVFLAPDGMQVDFDRRDGPNRWPDETFGTGSIEYTLGMCLNISSHWYCSAVVQFWYGRELSAGGRPDEVGLNWFYDPGRWGIMTGYQPSPGETVGLFVGSGNLRGRTDPGYVTCPRTCERSNVVLVPFSTDGSTNVSYGSKTVRSLK